VGLVTVAAWVINALIGVYLLYLWLSGGGLRQQATKVTRFPTTLIFSHPALAVTALAFWVAYLLTGQRLLAWLAFGVLSVAALLGFTMFTRWLGGGRHARGAEQRFPVLAVVAHGLVGLTTFVLVLVAASSIG
jgi:peptidoglycan biosynthesis protein MviN/MurJ (putative lipid II flippase)